MNKRPLNPFQTLVLLASLFSLASCLSAAEPPSVRLFDTRAAAPKPLRTDDWLKRERWTLLPEDQTKHKFKGDVVFANDRLAVVLRRKGNGAELYSLNPGKPELRAVLVPMQEAPAAALTAVKIVENNPGSVVVEATFKTAQGQALTLAYDLKLGQEFVQTQPRSGVNAIQVAAPCRYALLPDFFADDIVVDATEVTVGQAELPSENFLLQMAGDHDAIVMTVWNPAKDDVRVNVTGEGKERKITSSEIRYAKDGKISVAVLTNPGLWHERDIARTEAGEILHLDWKAPFTAHWRVDWRRDDALTDSWEMLSQKADGEYVKHGWYGQAESFGNIDWLKDGRKRWTTVLGSFLYPCWVDKNGEGYLQPLRKGVHFVGPALVYPINRLETTPLEEFTIVDIMRATLGVGPCEYILDVEGQKKTFQGRPTCASRTILDGIYTKKEQKERNAEVRQTLDEVIAFVRHIRGRIGDYVAFSHEIDAYLEAQKKAHAESETLLADMQKTARRIDAYVAQRKEGIRPPEDATQLVEDFRSNLVDYEGDDAVIKCKQVTAALVGIGGNQDELVGECRMVVKTLRQQAAMAMTTDPRVAPVATEVRRRTQQMLRNPASYEAPRH